MKELKKFLGTVITISTVPILGMVIGLLIGALFYGKPAAIFVFKIFVIIYFIIILIVAILQITSRKLRNGPLVFGTVVSAKTRRPSKDVCILELTIQFYTTDGRQVTASAPMEYSDIRLEVFQPGSLCPLKYHPEKPEKILIEIEMKEMDGATLERALDMYSEEVRNGPLAVGTIVSAVRSFVSVGDKIILNITVEFSTADGRQITASDRKLVDLNLDHVKLFQPSEMIVLRYHPENPERIMLLLHDEQEMLEHARKIREEMIKNGPLVFGMIVSKKSSGWQMGGVDIVDATIGFETIDGQVVTAHQRYISHSTEPWEDGLIPLRYNPENPQQIRMLQNEDEETLQQAFDAQLIARKVTTQEEIDIQRHGVKTTGVILSAQPTGNIVNGRGEMALQVKVTRPDGETFEATTNKAVSQDDLPSAQSGNKVEVFCMPENEEKIVISLLSLPETGGVPV